MLELAVPLKWDFHVPVLWNRLEDDNIVEAQTLTELSGRIDETNEEAKSAILRVARKLEEVSVKTVLAAKRGQLSDLRDLEKLQTAFGKRSDDKESH